MNPSENGTGARHWVKAAALGIAFLAVVIVLLLWLAGVFHPKIDLAEGPAEVGSAAGAADAARVAPAAGLGPADGVRLALARVVQVPQAESAVGTIRAVHESAVASKILARVVAVNVTAGSKVAEGDVLVQLDNADLAARLQQAEAARDAARAARDQARIELDRVRGLFEKNVAAKIEFDRAETALKSAEAELQRAERAAAEARTVLEYAEIRSPIDGVVVDKRVEAGDMATPGQVLLTLYDPTRMQLVAAVRETLARRLAVGQALDVRVDALEKTCQGRVSEIVPAAQAASRTFEVKVTGPCPPGVYTGMFGRLQIPLDVQEVLVIPRAAVRRVGQLTLVDVAEGGQLHRRAVQLGRTFDGDVEVLAGLREGEQVALE